VVPWSGIEEEEGGDEARRDWRGTEVDDVVSGAGVVEVAEVVAVACEGSGSVAVGATLV
jgi:hypothetical protein